jgi:hypothetical protein
MYVYVYIRHAEHEFATFKTYFWWDLLLHNHNYEGTLALVLGRDSMGIVQAWKSLGTNFTCFFSGRKIQILAQKALYKLRLLRPVADVQRMQILTQKTLYLLYWHKILTPKTRFFFLAPLLFRPVADVQRMLDGPQFTCFTTSTNAQILTQMYQLRIPPPPCRRHATHPPSSCAPLPFLSLLAQKS